jgi:hypothetical protein
MDELELYASVADLPCDEPDNQDGDDSTPPEQRHG